MILSTIIRVLVTILAFLVIFTIIVLSHEFGHYIIAKVNGINVKEFAIGLGPHIFSFTKWGTEFSINALPFGGACIFDDEEELLDDDKEKEILQSEAPLTDNDSINDGTFSNAPVLARIAVIFAGPLFNVVTAYIMVLIIVAFCGETLPVIKEVVADSKAEASGLEPGDKIVQINGDKIYIFQEISLHLLCDTDDVFDIQYERDGAVYNTTIDFSNNTGKKVFGIVAAEPADGKNFKVFEYGWYEIRFWLKTTVESIRMLVTGRLTKDDISGPVGMAQIVDNTIESTKQYGLLTVILNLVNIAVLLSVNLGIMNLLPIPALDGGKLLFLIVELVLRKRPPKKAEMIIQVVGFSCLMLLSIFVLFNDITKFFR